jgi:peptidoglycan/LPS O-acetylase OafA/YrhL
MDFANVAGKIDMKRKRNWPIWAGFVIVLVGFFSYTFFFAKFPITRDFPWANLLLFCVGGILLLISLFRAFGRPHVYRGKILASIFTIFSALMVGFFCYVFFYVLRQVPPSVGAPRVGQKAPEFTLPDQNEKPVALADLLSRSRAVVLIFYRGFW